MKVQYDWKDILDEQPEPKRLIIMKAGYDSGYAIGVFDKEDWSFIAKELDVTTIKVGADRGNESLTLSKNLSFPISRKRKKTKTDEPLPQLWDYFNLD